MGRRLAPIGTPMRNRLFMLSEEDANGCWIWQGSPRKGYGRVYDEVNQCSLAAHRASYELLVGPIPDGMTVDHLCFVPACVNPDHLRLLTWSENAANQRATFSPTCRAGHPFNEENTRIEAKTGRRRCRKCNAARVREYAARKRAAA